jgi:TFIIF-interacting CTD phosphatase-like protein
VKDLSLLNRDLSQTIIVDNSPMSYIFHPENAIDCGSFIDDLGDIELWQVLRPLPCAHPLATAWPTRYLSSNRFDI